MPELGVPVTFTDVRNVSVLCELSAMHAKLTPDLSLGAHFFNDLVEMGIVYLGIHSKREKEGYLFNEKLLLRMPNILSATLQEQDRLAGVIHLVEMKPGETEMFLHTNIMEQKGIVFRTRP
jgi:pyruvate,water dikinase